MSRPRKIADTIAQEPFNAEATLDGAATKEVLREKRIENAEAKFRFNTIKNLRELMQSPINIKNYPVHEFKAISLEPSDWGVSYFFPVAKAADGSLVPTYVDAPTSKRQLALCERKAEIMKELGKTYLVFQENNLITGENIRQELAARGESMIREGHIVTL